MKISYHFRDSSLKKLALTHRSADSPNNERLEFLGDAILGAVIAEYLYITFPKADEGQLTRTRASLVNRKSLASIARSLDLGAQISLGEGELKSGGWRRDSILSNTLEALIGAIYLDDGYESCREEILHWYVEVLKDVDPAKSAKDPKTQLQELLQGRNLGLPRYETRKVEGPAHKQVFTVSCSVELLSEPVIASSDSRRKAEQRAAAIALELIHNNDSD